MKQKIWIWLSVFAFSACVNPFSNQNSKIVFKYNESAGISSLDPAFARDQANIWACNQLFNGLVELNDALQIRPGIAKSWQIDANGKNYIFHLRTDVYFHQDTCFGNTKTRKVKADDFEYSLKRVLDDKTLSPGAQWLNGIIAKDGNSYQINALNDSTLEINLKEAFSPFLGRLSMLYFAVVPKEAIDYYGKDFSRNPVGTGPFKFKLWKEGVKLVLLKNENYFEIENSKRLPYLDAISISFIIDKQSSFLEFVKGNIDFMSGLDASYKDELLMPNGKIKGKYATKFKQLTNPYLNTEYFGILLKNEDNNNLNPLQIKQIRQAINYAFDRKKMIRYLRNNIGEPGVNGFVPSGLPGFTKHHTLGYSFQPDSVFSLLKRAGFPNGKKLPTIVLSTTSSYLDFCKYFQQQLGNFGIKIEIETQQAAALRTMIAQSKIDFFRGSWIADYADAENYLALFYSKNACPKGSNYTHFSNIKFDNLYEKSLQETNDSLRIILYQQMDQLIMNEAPIVVLYYDEVLRFTQNNIENLGINAMNLLSLKRVRKK